MSTLLENVVSRKQSEIWSKCSFVSLIVFTPQRRKHHNQSIKYIYIYIYIYIYTIFFLMPMPIPWS